MRKYISALWAALIIALAVAAPAYATTHPYAEGSTVLGASSDGNQHQVLSYNAPTDDWRSTRTAFVTTSTPLDVAAGDLLEIKLNAQFSNPNSSANGWWGVSSCCSGAWVQSEHWSLWTMEGNRVEMSGTQGAIGGVQVIPQMEQNFDNWMHYKDVSRSYFYKAPSAAAAQYFTASVYYVASKNYAQTGAYDMVLGGTEHPEIQVVDLG